MSTPPASTRPCCRRPRPRTWWSRRRASRRWPPPSRAWPRPGWPRPARGEPRVIAPPPTSWPGAPARAVVQAAAAIDTARRLESLPETAVAARRGDLSAEQTCAIVDAAAGNTAAEHDLLEAPRSPLAELREQCARTKATASRRPRGPPPPPSTTVVRSAPSPTRGRMAPPLPQQPRGRRPHHGRPRPLPEDNFHRARSESPPRAPRRLRRRRPGRDGSPLWGRRRSSQRARRGPRRCSPAPGHNRANGAALARGPGSHPPPTGPKLPRRDRGPSAAGADDTDGINGTDAPADGTGRQPGTTGPTLPRGAGGQPGPTGPTLPAGPAASRGRRGRRSPRGRRPAGADGDDAVRRSAQVRPSAQDRPVGHRRAADRRRRRYRPPGRTARRKAARRAVTHKVITRIDLATMLRGYPIEGEVCGARSPARAGGGVHCAGHARHRRPVPDRGGHQGRDGGGGPSRAAAQRAAADGPAVALPELCQRVLQRPGPSRLRPSADWSRPTSPSSICSIVSAGTVTPSRPENWSLVDGRGKRALVPPEDPRHPRNRAGHHPGRRRRRLMAGDESFGVVLPGGASGHWGRGPGTRSPSPGGAAGPMEPPGDGEVAAHEGAGRAASGGSTSRTGGHCCSARAQQWRRSRRW